MIVEECIDKFGRGKTVILLRDMDRTAGEKQIDEVMGPGEVK